MQIQYPLRQVRSFVRRTGRLTAGQALAFERLWSMYGVEHKGEKLDFTVLFGRNAPCVLEIGFGMGQSLLEMAKQHPHINFIGIEVHRPGIGALLAGMQREDITNIRVLATDAIDILQTCISDNDLAGVQLFFPDPWPKRRHQKRRIVQTSFIELLASKIKPQGFLHMATDWEDYASHMQTVLSQNQQFEALPLEDLRFIRPATKFEQRGLRLGHKIFEFLYNLNK